MLRKTREALQGYGYILPSFILLLMFYIVPIFMSGYYSFTNYNLVQTPDFVGLKNYVKLLNDDYIKAALKNTVAYTIITVPVQTILALGFADFIAFKLRNRKGEFLRSAMFIPVIASAVTSGAIWRILMNTDGGVINTVIARIGIAPLNWLGSSTLALFSICIVAVWKNVGYFLVIYYAGIMGLSKEIFEAADIDGASHWQVFSMITVPLLKPVSYLTVTLGIIWSFQVFDLSYIMTGGGPGKATVTLVMQIYQTAFKGGSKMGYSSAIAMLLLAVIVVVNIMENVIFSDKKAKRGAGL
ncbi:carbohydrate ABC transporter permease [Lacrimispora sp.]|uniref:carbohydrate ABC transporter permease n=1 Tax=Lacrimispora sp. TaxID=2719234 RepID=UPI0028A10637|nr:sugar ABC transporter permease [Lacrimispora sp.]